MPGSTCLSRSRQASAGGFADTPFRGAGRLGAGLVGLGLLALEGLAQAPLSRPEVVPLEPPPRWSTSAAWLVEGREVALADPIARALVVYSTDGRELRRVTQGPGGEAFKGPFALVPRGGLGWLLLDSTRDLAFLAADLSMQMRKALPRMGDDAVPAGAFREIVALELQPLDAGRVAVVADANAHDGWGSGVLELELERPGQARWLSRVSARDERWYLYRINVTPSLAVLDGVAHWLRLDAQPRIERLSAGPEVLPQLEALPLPAGFEAQPKPLGELGGAERYPLLHARLRQQRLPAGLWAHEGRLYLLTHEPAGGELAWSLWQHREGRWRGPFVVPTPAGTRDLMVLPGARSWAFLAKGAPTQAHRQPFLGLFQLPARTLVFP